MSITTAKELLTTVCGLIAKQRPDLAEQSYKELDTRIPDYMSLEHAQAEINRYWRLQLGVLDVSTFSVRECLLDNQPIRGWVANFRDYVVPFVSQHVKSLRGGK